jgi:hypothetical protein
MLVLVVALVERSGVPGEETGPRALAIVGLLSFAQAGQVSLAIGVGLAELNTTMITGAVVSFYPTSILYLCRILTALLRSLPLETHASFTERTMRVTVAYSSSLHTSPDVSLVVR